MNSQGQLVINAKGTQVFIDSSKWAKTGNNIFFKGTGNIGIGTIQPSAQLHTTATVRFAGLGTNVTNTKILTADADGNITTRLLSSLLSGNAIQSLNGLTTSSQTFAIGTAGTGFNISSSGNTHTFNLPSASATTSGALTTSDWNYFNKKIDKVTATTANAVTVSETAVNINNTEAFWNASQLQGNAVATNDPVSGQVLTWNGSAWTPATISQDKGAAILSNNFTTNSTSATNTNLRFAIAANETYYVIIEGTASKANTSTGMKLAVGAPTGCTISGEAFLGSSATAAPVPSVISATNTLGNTFATSASARVPFRLTFYVTSGSTAGFITLMAATVSSNTATIFAGARMSWAKATAL